MNYQLIDMVLFMHIFFSLNGEIICVSTFHVRLQGFRSPAVPPSRYFNMIHNLFF